MSRTVAPVVALVLALIWCSFIRVPLVANAPSHLDSDLAVDGITLQEAVDGHWRWHYPGTPYMGIGAVLLSYLPAKLLGVTPSTLVVGGTVAYLLLVAATFATAWICYGPSVAAWSLVPMAFASTGVIWLTGRITGGHMLCAAWSAAAWAIVAQFVRGGGLRYYALLGAWLGLGMWHDSMFLMTLIGMVPASLVARSERPGSTTKRMAIASFVLFCVCAGVGYAPRVIGKVLEPHDAYNDQFARTFEPELLKEHARILAFECLPRLVAGHRLPGLEADPDPDLLGGGAPVARLGRRSDIGLTAVAATALGLVMFAAGFLALAWRIVRRGSAEPPDAPPPYPMRIIISPAPAAPPPWLAGRAVALGLLTTSAALLAAFVVNRNIYNSDNYRYLVLLLTPASLGFGLAMDGLARRSTGGKVAAAALATAFSLAFAADAAAWYRRLGWIDDRGSLVRRAVDDPALRWLDENANVGAFAAGYWDAYRLAFLSRRPVRGVPHPIYPDRFPEWSRDLPNGRPTTLIARPSPEDQRFLQQALGEGGRVLFRERGTTIATWPTRP